MTHLGVHITVMMVRRGIFFGVNTTLVRVREGRNINYKGTKNEQRMHARQGKLDDLEARSAMDIAKKNAPL